ncbi:MAG: hypothetical protein JOZ64_01195 [Solirubrobacterales bacterium]|nr:hypothetical protein [Solirubrobacterales bacterium]
MACGAQQAPGFWRQNADVSPAPPLLPPAPDVPAPPEALAPPVPAVELAPALVVGDVVVEVVVGAAVVVGVEVVLGVELVRESVEVVAVPVEPVVSGVEELALAAVAGDAAVEEVGTVNGGAPALLAVLEPPPPQPPRATARPKLEMSAAAPVRR